MFDKHVTGTINRCFNFSMKNMSGSIHFSDILEEIEQLRKEITNTKPFLKTCVDS